MRWSIHALVNKPLALSMVACHYIGPLIIALVGILMRWTAYHGVGPLIIALVGI
jgi:hypothetical protein